MTTEELLRELQFTHKISIPYSDLSLVREWCKSNTTVFDRNTFEQWCDTHDVVCTMHPRHKMMSLSIR